MKDILLGVAPIAWTNDDMPEMGGDTPLEQCLKDMQDIGYKGTEIGNKFPQSGFAIRKLLQSYDLKLLSSWHSTFFLSPNFENERYRLQKKIKQIKDAGASLLNICECTKTIHNRKEEALSARPVIANDQHWERFFQHLNEAGKIASEQGVCLAYHHHMGTVVQSSEEVEKVLQNTDKDKMSLCFDTGHFAFAGEDPLKMWRKFYDRVAHVHLKDVRKEVLHSAKLQDWSFLRSVKEGVFTVPSDGMIDFRPLIKEIMESSYSGFFLVEAEQDPEKANPYDYAKKAFSFLAHLIEYNLSLMGGSRRV